MNYDSVNGFCGLAQANGAGTLALQKQDLASHPNWVLASPQGVSQGEFGLWHGSFLAQPADWSAFAYEVTGTYAVQHVDDHGKVVGTAGELSAGDEIWLGTDPGGGLAVAGSIAAKGTPPTSRAVAVFNADSIRWGPTKLDLDAPVFGIGVDVKHRVLVLQGGGALCSGCVAGQWFDWDGSSLGKPFAAITSFTPGAHTWFETTPLLYGGLAIRRLDAPADGSSHDFHSTWLATVPSGSSTPQAAPAWMTARPDTDLRLTRGGSGYAVLPNGATLSSCGQKLELVSISGNSCATYDLSPAPGSACTTLDLRLGLDGTVLQRLPPELETSADSSGRSRSCTVRFWPAALK